MCAACVSESVSLINIDGVGILIQCSAHVALIHFSLLAFLHVVHVMTSQK